MYVKKRTSSLLKNFHPTWESIQYWIILIAFLSVVSLSTFSALDICIDDCSKTKSYLFFGEPFAYFGIGLFTVAAFLHIFSRKIHFFKILVGGIVAGSIGAEVIFIWIQKYRIGSWCPICLTIAALLGLIGLLLGINLFLTHRKERHALILLKKVIGICLAAVIGVFVASVAISNPDENQISSLSIKDKLEFGNKESPIEIYFVTDWFCPGCKQLDSSIQKLAPELMAQAGFFFIDMPIHDGSENFSPYNLDFLVNHKDNYFQAREYLNNLSYETSSPDEATVQRAVYRAIPQIQELSFNERKAGIDFFNEVTKKYKITGTPEMVIVNTNTNNFKTLIGSDIDEENILKVIKTLNP